MQGETDRDRRMWEHTSSLMALMANTNRDSKRKPQPYTAADFSPCTIHENETSRGHEVTEEQKDQIAQWHVNPSSP